MQGFRANTTGAQNRLTSPGWDVSASGRQSSPFTALKSALKASSRLQKDLSWFLHHLQPVCGTEMLFWIPDFSHTHTHRMKGRKKAFILSLTSSRAASSCSASFWTGASQLAATLENHWVVTLWTALRQKGNCSKTAGIEGIFPFCRRNLWMFRDNRHLKKLLLFVHSLTTILVTMYCYAKSPHMRQENGFSHQNRCS